MIYYGSKQVVAVFVDILLNVFDIDLQSITVTKLGQSAVYSVLIVTDTSSVDTVKKMVDTSFLKELMSTSPPITLVG